MAQTQVGVEFDGDRVTVVEVVGDVAVATRSVDVGYLDESTQLALAGVKQTRNAAAIRVALATSSLNLRRIDVTAALQERHAFEDVAYSALPVDRQANSAAGLFFTPLDELSATVTSGVAVVAPSTEIAAGYRALGDRFSEVVAPPFTYRDFDGLWLALRYSNAEITLVSGEHPVAHRQLRAGGLNVVAAILGNGDTDEGLERLSVALDRTGNDPLAEAELDRWLRLVAAETRQTIDYWKRSGEPADGPVLVFGPGANAPGLAGAFSEHNLTRTWPDTFTKLMAFIAPADRPAALGAYLAAVTVGEDLPQAVFVNPDAVEIAAHLAERAARRRRSVVQATAALLVVASAGWPLADAFLDRAGARRDLAAAEATFAQRAEVAAQLDSLALRRTAADAALSTDPRWSTVIRLVYSSAAPNALISQMTGSKDSDRIVVTVAVDHPAGTYADLTAWMERLRAAGATQTWSPAFSSRDGKASYQVTFAYPLELLVTPTSLADRPAGGANQAPAVPAPTDPAGADPAASAAPVPTEPTEEVAP